LGDAEVSPDTTLEFEGGYLRPLKPADVHSGYVVGLNDPEVNRYLEVRHAIQTMSSVVNFVAVNEQSSDSVLWGVWQSNTPNHCGTVRIHAIERHIKRAQIGVCLFDKTAWRQRLGSQAIRAVTSWAFQELEMEWVEAGAYVDNIASQKAFLAAGYTWIFDIPNKFYLEGNSTTVRVFVARNEPIK
jgi:ribosomal-protein-alanine N-acetyltransferase